MYIFTGYVFCLLTPLWKVNKFAIILLIVFCIKSFCLFVLFWLFYHCHCHICPAMAWLIKMGACGFLHPGIFDIITMVYYYELDGSFCSPLYYCCHFFLLLYDYIYLILTTKNHRSKRYCNFARWIGGVAYGKFCYQWGLLV